MNNLPTPWVAAGVCHEILLRTLPSLRHDLAGILSVARMDLALLKRWVAKLGSDGAEDPASTAERLQRVDQQFGTLLQALQGLQAWGDEEVAPTPTADELLDACLGWVRPVLMLAKIAAERSEPAVAATMAPVSPSTFKYLCLGAVWYWVDNRPALSGLVLSLQAPGVLVVRAVEHPGGAQPDPGRAPKPVLAPVDQDALAAVAARGGWQLNVGTSALQLRWA